MALSDTPQVQLLAYHGAVPNRTDVDLRRNPAKIVIVA